MQVPAIATLKALEEVDGMADELVSVVSLLDAESTMLSAAEAVRARTGLSVGFLGTTGEDGTAVHLRRVAGGRAGTLEGLRVATGTGLGGQVLLEHRVRWVEDYAASRTITHEHDVPVGAEGLRAMVAVPIIRSGQLLGTLYGANRDPGPISDQICAAMEEIAAQTGMLLEAADRARGLAEHAVAQERARLAGALHDSVGAMLFAIGAGATELAHEVAEIPELAARAQALVERASAATAALRRSLRALHEQPSPVALGVGLGAEATAFTDRTGIPARTIVLTQLPDLGDAPLKALVTAVREALHNVEKHAAATSVVVTAAAARGGVAVAVADDGRGLRGCDVERGSEAPTGLGVEGAAIRLARIGGTVQLLDNDEGGATLRAWVPA